MDFSFFIGTLGVRLTSVKKRWTLRSGVEKGFFSILKWTIHRLAYSSSRKSAWIETLTYRKALSAVSILVSTAGLPQPKYPLTSH